MVMEEGNNDILSNIDRTVEADNSISQEELNKALNEGMFDKEEDVRLVSEALKNDQNELAQSLKTSLNAAVDKILDNPDGITEDSKKILKLWCSLIGESDQEKYGKAREILGLSKKAPPTEKNNDLGSGGGGEHQVENVEKFSNDDIKTAESELKNILKKIKQRDKDFLWSGLQKNKDAIKYIQILLKVNGYVVNQYEGDFDKNTKEAIIKFQNDHKPLVADGKVGRFTLDKLLNTAQTRDAISASMVLGNDNGGDMNIVDENAENEYGGIENIQQIRLEQISFKNMQEQFDELGGKYIEYHGIKYKRIKKEESGVGYKVANLTNGKKGYILGNFNENGRTNYGIEITENWVYKGGLKKGQFHGIGEYCRKKGLSKGWKYKNSTFENGNIIKGTVMFPNINSDGTKNDYTSFKGSFKNWYPDGEGVAWYVPGNQQHIVRVSGSRWERVPQDPINS